MKKPKIVVVHWIDAELGYGTWKEYKEARKHRAPVVRSIGYLLKRGKKNVVLASSASGNGGKFTHRSCVMNDIVIPAGMVKKIRVIGGGLK